MFLVSGALGGPCLHWIPFGRVQQQKGPPRRRAELDGFLPYRHCTGREDGSVPPRAHHYTNRAAPSHAADGARVRAARLAGAGRGRAAIRGRWSQRYWAEIQTVIQLSHRQSDPSKWYLRSVLERDCSNDETGHIGPQLCRSAERVPQCSQTLAGVRNHRRYSDHPAGQRKVLSSS